MSRQPVNLGQYVSNITQTTGNALFIVDPQLDFHPDDGKRGYQGSLAVPGANEDALRIKKFIEDNIDDIDEVYVTMDTHMNYHIAHPMYWVNSKGEHPTPFTTISKEDVRTSKWTPALKTAKSWALTYVTALERQGRFKLTIWPEHCRIGTKGHLVHEGIGEALEKWERKRTKSAHFIVKGNNSNTEHYSALRAEVEIKTEPDTKLNVELLSQLKKHKRIFICGQALSHCVNYTTRDLVENWGDNNFSPICILEDASSPVKGFEKEASTFLKDMEKKKIKICTTKEAKKFIAK